MPNRMALLLTVCYAIFAGLIVAIGLPPFVAAVVLSPLVLFAPGYALISALNVSERHSFPWRRQVLAVTMSMAAVVLGGLVLNAFFSLTTTTWTLWLVGLTCICCAVALARSQGLPFVPRGSRRAGQPVLRWRAVLTGSAVFLALAGAIALTEVNGRGTYDKSITQLSLVSLSRSGRSPLRLVVTNLASRDDRLVLTVISGGRRIARMGLVIAPSRSWTGDVTGWTRYVTATLTRPGVSTPISEVTWSADNRSRT